MSESEWYRNTEWTPAIAEAFEKRLSRSRGSRGEYLRIQALTLAESEKSEFAIVAISLARRHLALEPQGIFAAQMHAGIAKAFETIGDISSAVDAYRSAVELEHQRPNVRGNHYLDFLWFVALRALAPLYDEVIAVVARNKHDSNLVFPKCQYRYFASLALISSALGDSENAKRMAKNALQSAAKEKGPFWRFPRMGLVIGEKDLTRARLKRIAG